MHGLYNLKNIFPVFWNTKKLFVYWKGKTRVHEFACDGHW